MYSKRKSAIFHVVESCKSLLHSFSVLHAIWISNDQTFMPRIISITLPTTYFCVTITVMCKLSMCNFSPLRSLILQFSSVVALLYLSSQQYVRYVDCRRSLRLQLAKKLYFISRCRPKNHFSFLSSLPLFRLLLIPFFFLSYLRCDITQNLRLSSGILFQDNR